MEVHQQHLIRYEAVDFGASSHFYPIDYNYTVGEQQHDPTTVDPIRVSCADKAGMVSLADSGYYRGVFFKHNCTFILTS